MDAKEVTELARKYRSRPSAPLAVMQDIQRAEGYLPEELLRLVSEGLQVPLSEIYRMATFYHALSLKPRGKHVIQVCLGTACHLRGGPRLVEALGEELNIGEGETTQDRRFTLQTVHCLGACALAPVITLDGEYHGKMTPAKLVELLDQYREAG